MANIKEYLVSFSYSKVTRVYKDSNEKQKYDTTYNLKESRIFNKKELKEFILNFNRNICYDKVGARFNLQILFMEEL